VACAAAAAAAACLACTQDWAADCCGGITAQQKLELPLLLLLLLRVGRYSRAATAAVCVPLQSSYNRCCCCEQAIHIKLQQLLLWLIGLVKCGDGSCVSWLACKQHALLLPEQQHALLLAGQLAYLQAACAAAACVSMHSSSSC
jgi:hypothetical protein